MLAKIAENIHLGDKIACCVVLYNIAKATNNKIILYEHCNIVKTIINKLNFNKLLKLESNEKTNNKLNFFSISDFVPNLEKTKVIFLNTKFISLELEKKILLNSISLPHFKECQKENITHFQFDCRSEHDFKKNISLEYQIKFLNKNAKFKSVGIGGKDTKKNLPYEYKLLELKEIINSIKKSNQFVGVDSGISHICGVLRIPSSIIITHNRPKDIFDISYFYNFFYKIKCDSKLIKII